MQQTEQMAIRVRPGTRERLRKVANAGRLTMGDALYEMLGFGGTLLWLKYAANKKAPQTQETREAKKLLQDLSSLLQKGNELRMAALRRSLEERERFDCDWFESPDE